MPRLNRLTGKGSASVSPTWVVMGVLMQGFVLLRSVCHMPCHANKLPRAQLFPTTEYSSKQPSDPVVPLVPCTGIFLGPSKSGKTVALISLILEQYRGAFERVYIFSPSVNIDDGWIPVKKYIEEDLGEHRAGADVLGRVAAHRPATVQDHGGVQEVGNEETVPGACSHQRLC